MMEQRDVLQLLDCVVEVSRTNVNKEELFKILKHLKPKWTPNDVICTVLSGGYANLTLRCYEKKDPDDSVVFRIWSETLTTHFGSIVNRRTETGMIHKLGEIGVAPKLYAAFKNGICYEYIDGGKLTTDLCRTDEVAKLIAKNLAKVHGIKLENCSSELQTMDMINLGYKTYPLQLPDPEKNKILQASIPSREEMAKEIEFIEQYIKELQCPVVQCHGDPHAQNMMSNKTTGDIIFLDYELTHLGYQPHDITYFFLMLSIDYNDFNEGFYSGELPDKTYQCKFLRWYLEEWFEISGKSASEVTERDVERLFVQVNKFVLFTQFYFVMIFFQLYTMESKEGLHEDITKLDYIKLAIEHLQKYFERKEYWLSLTIPE